MLVEPVSAPTSVRRSRHAFVADDNATLRAVLCDLLLREGYSVSAATNGKDLFAQLLCSFAAEAKGAAGVDVVVSDLWMPFASGLDVLRRVRAAERRTPFVVVTGDEDPSLRGRVEALDGCFLPKPFTADGLHFAIRWALDRPAVSKGNDVSV